MNQPPQETIPIEKLDARISSIKRFKGKQTETVKSGNMEDERFRAIYDDPAFQIDENRQPHDQGNWTDSEERVLRLGYQIRCLFLTIRFQRSHKQASNPMLFLKRIFHSNPERRRKRRNPFNPKTLLNSNSFQNQRKNILFVSKDKSKNILNRYQSLEA